MGIYPWASIDVGGKEDGKQMQYNLELFRRILESLAKEPVEIISEPDYLSGMRQCRVHFRYSQFYMMVDINIMRYGDVPIEKLAHDCYERMMTYRRENNRENVNSAYNSMGGWTPDWNKTKKPDKRATPEENRKARAENNAKLSSKPPVGSYENPLRVELQKRVDAWLK